MGPAIKWFVFRAKDENIYVYKIMKFILLGQYLQFTDHYSLRTQMCELKVTIEKLCYWGKIPAI